MWIIRRYRPSKAPVFFFLILFIICLYIKFSKNIFPETVTIKISKIIPDINNSSNIFPETVTIKISKIIPDIKNSSNIYLHVKLDLTSNTAICQVYDYLIIYILSTVDNIQRRNVIRSTWTSKQKGVCFVFILGHVSSNTNEIQMKIDNEKKEYQDIVQINHTESYANVVYKEIGALQWSQHFYPNIPYLFKTDDDLIVDTILVKSIAHLLLTNVSTKNSVLSKYRPGLISMIQKADRATFFRGGWAMDYQPTLRGGGKFGVSEHVWPHSVLPPYCSGFGWFMSKNVRDQLVNASYTYPVKKTVWIGDAFVSGFLAKPANVKCTGITIDYDQTTSANCSCLMVNNPMLTVCSSSFHAGGGGTEIQRYNEYQKAWKVIQFRHNLTNTTINDC